MLEIYPLKAQYLLNEKVSLRINSDEKIIRGELAIYSINKLIETIVIKDTSDVKIDTSNYLKGGYGVNLICETKDGIKETYTSFDICKDPNTSLRYGFISDFEDKDLNNGALDWLRKCHINIVQFYDWSYRHDNLVSDDDEYYDMMGKHISRNVVIEKNKEALSYGMRGIAYGAVYAASKDYFDKHQDLALYYPDGKAITFIDVFYLMNIEKGSLWRRHLIKQYSSAIQKMGFKGIHMDTYGFPKKAISLLKKRHVISLDKEFKTLINETKSKLKDVLLIFNNVGNWPVDKTANSDIDSVYIEVWDPYDRYHHIVSIINEAKLNLKKNKPIILAAYLKAFRLENIEKGMNAAKLLMALIVSNGAYHLLIGENKAVLTQGYYSDYTRLDDISALDIKAYYDFMIRYYDLFYDNHLKDVSKTHFGGDNREYLSSNRKISVNNEADKLWAIIRENKKYKIINFINLCGNKDDIWNKGKNEPIIQKNIDFKIMVQNDIKGAYVTSPDFNNQRMNELKYKIVDNKMGRYLNIKVPYVKYWTMLVVEL